MISIEEQKKVLGNKSLRLYTAEAHNMINKHLRTPEKLDGESLKHLENLINDIKSTMKNKKFGDTILYRGLGKNATHLLEKDSYVDLGFISTSYHLNVAKRFGNDVMAILPQGMVRHVEPDEHDIRNEKEVILHPGYKLTKCDKNLMLNYNGVRIFPYVLHELDTKPDLQKAFTKISSALISPKLPSPKTLGRYTEIAKECIENDIRALDPEADITKEDIEMCLSQYKLDSHAIEAIYLSLFAN
jgi:hypothetical protein